MKYLYIAYQFLVALPVMLVVTLLSAVTCIVGCLFDNRFWGYWPGMIWGRMFCLVFLIPVRVNGRENIEKGRSYVMVSNHQSAFDIFSLYGHIGVRFKWMIKKEILRIPFVGRACKSAGFIFVDRESAFGSTGSLNEAKSRLVDGMSLLVFPEGTRTRNGQMGRFKRGSFKIAADLGLPVLPITLNGCFDVLRPGAWHVSRHPITITVHKPLEADANDLRGTADRVAGIIENSLNKN